MWIARFDGFFVLQDPLTPDAIRLDVRNVAWNEMQDIFSGSQPVRQPVNMVHDMGSRLHDVVWTSLNPLVVRERVVKLMTDYGLSGWKTYPLDLPDIVDSEKYCGLCILGRCGPIDDAKSKIVMKQYPAGDFPIYKGLYFDLDTWDGSDLCLTSDESMWLIATERVRAAFIEEGVTNVDFVPLREFERVSL